MKPVPATVAILSTHPARAQAWAEAVVQAGLRVGDPSQPGPVAVVLTDTPLGPETYPSEWQACGPAEAPPGVILVGQAGPADVSLPADATPREIGLACQLLARLVQLRRQLVRQSELHQRLVEEACTDQLTGLGNRRAWDQALTERTSGDQDQPLCLAMLDLDRFKPINDRHGHPVGDRVLQAVGRCLVNSLRSGDVVARLGGDEFGLLLSVPTTAVAATVVERVRRRLPAALAEAGLPAVTASAGYCLAEPEPPCDPQVLVTAADRALHAAKQQGRDRSVGEVK